MEAKMKKYMEDGGVACPFCGCEDIEGSQVEIDAGFAFQKISCTKCEKTWIDYYSYDCVAVENEDGDLVVYNKNDIVEEGEKP